MGQQKKYQRIYLSCFAFVAMLIIAAVLIIDDIVAEEGVMIELNDIGGRQRALSERTTHLLLEYAAEQNKDNRKRIVGMIEKTLGEFDTTHKLLIRGRLANGRKVDYSDAVDDIFWSPPEYLDEKARIFIYNSREVLLDDWTPDIVSSFYLKQLREAMKQDLHDGLQVLAQQYTLDSKARITRLRAIVALLLGGILAVLIAIGALVFNPMFRRIISQEAELHRLAYIDPLTECRNRRSFLDSAATAFERSERYDHNYAILYIDIDDFKDINDSHGHNFGDEALRQVVRLCQENLRDSDVFGRLGGDEFAVILQECDHNFAMQTAEKLRRIVSEHIVFHAGASARLSISVGVSTLSGSDDDYNDTLIRADRNLYQAKNTGRNRVITASSTQ